MKKMKRCRTSFAVLLAVSMMTGCAAETKKAQPQGKMYFTYFDTISCVYSYAGDSAECFDERSAEVSNILGEYNQLLDIYHEYEGINNLCTINKNAGGEPLKVDERLMEFLDYAKEIYQLTSGEMNVMMGSVLSLWHQCRELAAENPEQARLPNQAELERAGEHMSIEALELDHENMTVRISDPEASIDVGALGKGYATQKAAEYLIEEKAEGYVLNIGGNIRIIGTKPDGTGWLTGIRDPQGTEQDYCIGLRLKNTACVTSGIYERYFTVDGLRYHHIIDKDTLYPAAGFASLTVLTEDSGLADGLSTALFCMSYEEGKALVDSLDGVEALWIFDDGKILYTDGVEELIEQ
jgi:thiamine biosynthesis lipoprotein